YVYTVKAYDASSNISAASTGLSVRTNDTQAPTVPSGLKVDAKTDKTVNISWTASTDNVGVSGYEVYRNGTKLASVIGTVYADLGLTQGTLYVYTVKAYDASSNISAASAGLSVRTNDTQAPTVPTGLKVDAKTDKTVNISWTASTDNVGVSGYEVYRNGTKLARVTGTVYADSGLTQGTLYVYTVKAYDATSNISAASAGLSVRTNDTQAPTVPTGLKVDAKTDKTVNISWTASTDNVGVSGYEVYRNGTKLASVTGTVYADSGLTQGTLYVYTVKAYDASNISAASTGLSVRTNDTQAPTVPTGLKVDAKTDKTVNISWTASTDNVGVAGYEVYRNGTKLASVTGTVYADSGLTQGTLYVYTVKAYDATNNVSAASAGLSVRTNDTQAPTVPVGLKVDAKTDKTVNISWTTSTDNVGVTCYEVYRNGTKLASVTGTVYADSGLTQGALYVYTVKAYDASSNISAASAGLSVRTNDTQAPTAPTGLKVDAKTDKTVNISWTASTDNVGVTGYEVYRNGTKLARVTGTVYADSGLTQGTLYVYTVKAYDASSNISAASAGLSVITNDTQAPTVPTGLKVDAKTDKTVNISWTASTDNVGVSGYEVYRNGTKLASVTGTVYADLGLIQGTLYVYTVKAYDATSNISAASAGLSVRTND
ncbi:fibronectin type III domain-containing protein, partial [Pseudobacteroides cellulosolvens]|uniref:fibronectin type III domain-containing protein n=1 Tax=Pseudobacteroides cellulosolvens TaxID=35825 RepID=UPI0039089936